MTNGNNEINEEIQSHLEIEIQQNIAAGMSPEDARNAALRKFGSVTLAMERTREVWRFTWLEALGQDLRYGLRTLRRSPGFTAVTVLSLALGIGANTAIFSLVDAVLLKSLPVKDPKNLVLVEPLYRGEPQGSLSFPIFRDLAARQNVLEGLCAAGSLSFVRASIQGFGDLDPVQFRARLVSGNYFDVLGVSPILGRGLAPDDEQGAVISYAFWERQFGRDPSVLGRVINLDRDRFTIAGVAPRGFSGEAVGMAPDVWVHAEGIPRLAKVRTVSLVRLIGRANPEISRQQTEAALTAVYRQALAEEVSSGEGTRINRPRPEDARIVLQPGRRGLDGLRRQFSQPLQILMGVVGLVLLIACANVTNLLLARAMSREKEIGIRLAIGAGRGRVIRQVLTESTLLGLLGGAAGLYLAFLTRDFLVSLAAVRLDLGLDWRVFAFTLTVSLLTGLLFGLAPALRATSATWSGTRILGLSRLLVGAQIALSLVLLTGAGLLVRTLQNFRNLGAGIQPENVMLVDLRVDSAVVQRAELAATVRQLEERLAALPSVRSASLAESSPFTRSATTVPVRVPDSPRDPALDGDIRQSWVTPRYFQTLGMRLLSGREFSARDDATAPKVAIVNETMASHYFGDRSPLGSRIYFPKLDSRGRYIPFAKDPGQEFEIIGVVQDAKYDNLRQNTPRMAFLPWRQGTPRLASVAVRATGDPALLATSIRKLLEETNPNLIVREIRTLEDQIDRTLGQERLVAQLLTFFGLLALSLACVGLYGLMAYTVARRTREIGIRVALGADRGDMARMVLRETLLLAAAGLALGIPASLAATRLLDRFLFGVKPTDPVTIVVAAACMSVVALLAGYIPARRAAAVNPMVALRYE